MARVVTPFRKAAAAASLFSLLIALSGAATGCDRSTDERDGEEAAQADDAEQRADEAKEENDGPTIEYAEGPEPGPETVLGETDGIQVTLADFEESMQRSMLVAPEGTTELPKERLATPQLQMNVVRNLLNSKVISREAERRGLEVSEKDKLEALEAHPQLKRLAPILEERKEGADELARHELTLDDLDAVATDLAERHKLREALLDEIDDERLWEAYRREHDRLDLLLVSVRNRPSSQAIDAYAESNADKIAEHFEENKRDYRHPRMVRLVRLMPESRSEADEATLEEAAERLEAGEAPEQIADELGLRADPNALMVRKENREAFHSEEGEVGYQMRGPRGPYAWRVEGFRESKEAELDRPLRREIASELMRREKIISSHGEKVRDAIATLEALPTDEQGRVPAEALNALVDELRDEGLEVDRTDSFTRNERGYIPGAGLLEEVAERAFSLTMDDPVVDEPILSRGKVWAVRLLDRERPSRERFEEEKDSFREAFVDQMEERILQDFVREFQRERGTEFDLSPLRVKYGTLQKD